MLTYAYIRTQKHKFTSNTLNMTQKPCVYCLTIVKNQGSNLFNKDGMFCRQPFEIVCLRPPQQFSQHFHTLCNCNHGYIMPRRRSKWSGQTFSYFCLFHLFLLSPFLYSLTIWKTRKVVEIITDIKDSLVSGFITIAKCLQHVLYVFRILSRKQ